MKLSNRTYAIMIGIGIVLFAIHHPDQPLIQYMFLPSIGMFLLSIGVVFYLMYNWGKLTLGDKKIWIPLLVIVVSIIGSSIVQLFNNSELDVMKGLSPVAFGLLLFGLYVVARAVDKDIFLPFTWAVVIGSLGCVIYGFAYPGKPTGGFISPTNYDMATGLLVFGTVVSVVHRQWWLSAIAVVGLFFTGSPEAVFAIVTLGIVMLIRRDWGVKMIIPVSLLLVVGIVGIVNVFTTEHSLYAYTANKITTVVENPTDEGELNKALTGRWGRIEEAMTNIQPLGEGYTITDFNTYTVHNVPLVIVQQIGIVAALAWLWVTFFCLIKTKWKYAWSAVLILGVFDHFMWTQVAPWWWALVGVSTVSNIKSDLIFRRA